MNPQDQAQAQPQSHGRPPTPGAAQDLHRKLVEAVRDAGRDHSRTAAAPAPGAPPKAIAPVAVVEAFAPVAVKTVLGILVSNFGPTLERVAAAAAGSVGQFVDAPTLQEFNKLLALLAEGEPASTSQST
jgi:hypothetical protein